MPAESATKSSTLVAVLLMGLAVIVSAVAVWTAWDDGGGHRSTQWIGTLVILWTVPLAVIAGWLQRTYRPPAVVVLAIVVWLVGAAQCLPLPPGLVKVLSPGSYAAYREWLPESIRTEALEWPESPATTIASHAIPISVSPTFTRMALALPLLFAAGCWISSLCFASRRAALVLLVVPAVVGGLFAFFGLADMIRLARDSEVELRQRLIITPVGADGPFGPFINNNNCAGYLNLTIGCALGLLMGMRYRASEDARSGPMRHLPTVACVLLIVVMVAGILGSQSRGGFLGLATGTVVMTLLATRGWSRIGLVAALTVIAVASLAFLDELGIRDRTADRLETLVDGTAQNDPRFRVWHEGFTAAKAHLPAGAGWGAYRYGHMPYQDRGSELWAVNADGMHVEWLLEGGLWLIPILVVGVVITIRDVLGLGHRLRMLPLADARLARAVTVATTFGLASLFATQSFDFGITRIPQLMTFALLVGGVASLRRMADGAPTLDRRGMRMSIVSVALVFGGLMLATGSLRSGSIWEGIKNKQNAQRRLPMSQRDSFDGDIARLQSLVTSHPRDALAHRMYARLLLSRQHQIGTLALLNGELTDARKATLWASPSNVRKAFYQSGLSVEELMLEGQDSDQWRLARRHALTALVLSPLDENARILLVDTDFLDEGLNKATPELLVQAARLRPRTRHILNYVEALAAAHPGGETLEQVREIRSGK